MIRHTILTIRTNVLDHLRVRYIGTFEYSMKQENIFLFKSDQRQLTFLFPSKKFFFSLGFVIGLIIDMYFLILYMGKMQTKDFRNAEQISMYIYPLFDVFQMEKFEINACVKWIGEKNFHTIALQVPDKDLDKVHDLIERLKSEIQIENLEFFLVGEGCSPCCNDLLNAQYCQAQGLIHFGHSCLSTTWSDQQQTMPVLYVFFQQSLPYVYYVLYSH